MWQECPACKRFVLTTLQADNSFACTECGVDVNPVGDDGFDNWLLCDTCGKWRSVDAAMAEAAKASDAKWTCSMRRPGATCKGGPDDWGHKCKRMTGTQHSLSLPAVTLGPDPESLSERHVVPHKRRRAKRCYWTRTHDRPQLPNETRTEFVHGRDELFEAAALASGLDAYDTELNNEHFLSVQHVRRDTLELAEPFVLKAVSLYNQGKLPICDDGRAAAGPIDLPNYLEEPRVRADVDAALQKRWERIGEEEPRAQALRYVVHINPNLRTFYIGDEHDRTVNGTKPMDYNKAWKSPPIRSWSGGHKVADMPGKQQNKIVLSKLSELLAAEEPGLIAMAERLWDSFKSHEPTAAAAQQMDDYLNSTEARAATRLGRTGWNAYSFNLDFPTARHLDCKNVKGSYSGLLVVELGAKFCGGLYMLPQYHKALELRQGTAAFHRSGDPEVGDHGNSALHLPVPGSHRVALVLYQTHIAENVAAPDGTLPVEPEQADATAPAAEAGAAAGTA